MTWFDELRQVTFGTCRGSHERIEYFPMESGSQ